MRIEITQENYRETVYIFMNPRYESYAEQKRNTYLHYTLIPKSKSIASIELSKKHTNLTVRQEEQLLDTLEYKHLKDM